jgi:hypothetical protein
MPTGNCGSYVYITGANECLAAAAALGITDRTLNTATLSFPPRRPSGCYYKNDERSNDMTMHLNNEGDASKSNTDTNRQSICYRCESRAAYVCVSGVSASVCCCCLTQPHLSLRPQHVSFWECVRAVLKRCVLLGPV